VCVERLIGKQKKPILFKVTEPSSVPYRAPPACAKITGPLLSLVFRTEDVWQRYNQFIETFRGSQSGFPLLTPTMQAGQDSDGFEEMCTLHAGVMLCIVFVTMLPDRVDDSSTSTICLYLSLIATVYSEVYPSDMPPLLARLEPSHEYIRPH
jgi:hypothetical protein